MTRAPRCPQLSDRPAQTITGVTGLAIIRAIVAGQRDPLELAKLRDDRYGHSEAEIARALYGTWRSEHLFALKQALELYDFYHNELAACDREIVKHLQMGFISAHTARFS